MRIFAIILDGFHKGHMVRMEYMPTIKLIKPKTVTIDYCCDPDVSFNSEEETLTYKECFYGRMKF